MRPKVRFSIPILSRWPGSKARLAKFLQEKRLQHRFLHGSGSRLGQGFSGLDASLANGSEDLIAHLRPRLRTEKLQSQTYHSCKSISDFLAQSLKVRRGWVLQEPFCLIQVGCIFRIENMRWHRKLSFYLKVLRPYCLF